VQHLLSELIDAIDSGLGKAAVADPSVQTAVLHLLTGVRRAREQPFTVAPHGYADVVEEAIEATTSNLAAIAMRLRPVCPSLPWTYHYQPRSAAEDLSNRVAFAEMIGPDGPLLAPGCRIGFTWMEKRTIYPMHCHPAVELYWEFRGNARRQTPSSDRRVPPGEFVLHSSAEPHAMQTYEEPLLALWGWSGDVDAPAVYL